MWWNAAKEFSLQGTVCDGYVMDAYDGACVWLVMPYADKYFKWNCVLDGVEIPDFVFRDFNTYVEGSVFCTALLKERVLHKTVKVVCGDFDSAGRVRVNLFVNDDDDEDVNAYLRHAMELPV